MQECSRDARDTEATSGARHQLYDLLGENLEALLLGQGYLPLASVHFLDFDYVRDRLKQFDQLGESVIRYATLMTEVMVIGRYKLVEQHSALRCVLQ